MNDWGERIHEVANLNDDEASGIVDNRLTDWRIAHNIDAAALRDPRFALILKRVNGMQREYIVPTNEQLNGNLLNRKYSEEVALVNRVESFVLLLVV